MSALRCERCGRETSEPHDCSAYRSGDTLTAPRVASQPPPAAPEPTRGAVLAGRYRLLEMVGEGGGGMVFRAEDLELGVHVALKILRPGPSYEMLLLRLKREIRITRDIDHPNVSRVFDLSESGGLTFFTMRWVDGEALHRRVQKEGPLGRDALRRLARGLVAALAAAHRLGIVHRDVKPANVLVSEAGDPVLVDFGIATDVGQSPDAHARRGAPITLSGQIPGTPAFMAPEQADGKSSPPATDLWSLALTIAYASEGKIHRPEQPRRAFLAQGSPLSGLLARCLDPDPARRPRDAVVLADAIVSADRRRRFVRTSAVWAALVLAVAVAGVVATRRAAEVAVHGGPPLVWVGEIENATGDADLDWLAAGVGDLLRTGLESSGRARLAPDARMRGVARIAGRLARGGAVELRLSSPGVRDRARFTGAEGEGLFRGIDVATERFLAALGAPAPVRARTAAPSPLTRNHRALAEYERAQTFIFAHQNREALDALRRAVEADPEFAAAHLERFTLALGGHGTIAEADAALARAAAIPERLSPSARELLGAVREARSRGVAKAPLGRLRAFLRSHPPDSAVYWMASTIPNGDRSDVRAILEEWAARLPDDPEPHNRLGYVLMEFYADTAGAEREFLAYLRLAPRDANAHDSYADFLAGQGRNADAIREYDRALEIDPRFVNAAVDLAGVLLREGELGAAEDKLGRARPLLAAMRETEAWVETAGAVPLLAGDSRRALDLLAEIVRDPAFGSRAYLALEYAAIVRAHGGDLAGARRAASEAVERCRQFHGDATVLVSLRPYVDALWALGRKDGQALDRAAADLGALGASLDPKMEPRRRLVHALQSVLHDEPAVAAERLVESMVPGRTATGFVAAHERARALVRAGRAPEAAAAYVDAIDRAGDHLRNPEAAAGIRECLKEAADVERSIGHADRATELETRLATLARALPR